MRAHASVSFLVALRRAEIIGLKGITEAESRARFNARSESSRGFRSVTQTRNRFPLSSVSFGGPSAACEPDARNSRKCFESLAPLLPVPMLFPSLFCLRGDLSPCATKLPKLSRGGCLCRFARATMNATRRRGAQVHRVAQRNISKKIADEFDGGAED